MSNNDSLNSANGKGLGNLSNPWDPWGCIWRFLLFLAGIVLITFLYATLRDGHKDNPSDNPIDNPTDKPFDPSNPYEPVHPYPEVPDSVVEDWPGTIPDVPELPDSAHNYIPPIDSTRMVVNPQDSISYIIDNQVVVLFNSKQLKDDITSFAQQFKQVYPDPAYEVAYYNATAGTMLLNVPETMALQVVKELPQKITGIDFKAFTNEVFQCASQPSDPDFSYQSYDQYFNLIQAYDAWDITQGSDSVKVAIVDSYFDLSNPEIGERYVDNIYIPTHSQNVFPPQRAPKDLNEFCVFIHGSHVAGIAIGAANNGKGCSGIAPKCQWIPVALGDQMTTFNCIEGLLYAVYHGADVVNYSIGKKFMRGLDKMLSLDDQVDRATVPNAGEDVWDYVAKVFEDHNCVLVTAAGNDNILMGLDVMKKNDKMVKVENLHGSGKKAQSSSFGIVSKRQVNYSTVAAPGTHIWSATYAPFSYLASMLTDEYGHMKVSKDGLFQEASGTSMASPVVAGAVALMKSKKKDITVQEVIDILKLTAKQTDDSGLLGPTLQIRDALDMVGGLKLKYDDVLKNHNLIIGKWKSTEVLCLVDENDKQIDTVWDFFIFTSSTEGTMEHQTVNLNRRYQADLEIVWHQNDFEIIQKTQAIDINDSKNVMAIYKFTCKPDKNGYLEVTGVKPSGDTINFYLEKVN